MPTDPFVEAGARQIISTCLALEPGQEFVVLADETTLKTAEILAEAAQSLRVPHTLLVVPVSIQRLIPQQTEMSLLAQGAARQGRALLCAPSMGADLRVRVPYGG